MAGSLTTKVVSIFFSRIWENHIYPRKFGYMVMYKEAHEPVYT